MKTIHKIVTGDSRKMSLVNDRSVQLIITSPPYWQLKDYGSDEQIGYNDDYETYINNLNLVWKECYRVLDNGCRLCINIGDQFARAVYYGRYKVIPIRTEIIKFCESIGFDYMGAIIWQKQTTTNTTGGASLMGSYPTPRNGIISIDYEFILIFKKLGRPSVKVSKEIKEASKLTIEEWRQYFAGHWNFAGAKQQDHLAMFPEELPKRLIKMFAFKGETVLDPFLGSGTTSLAAKNLGRNSIGYEINKDYVNIIKQKLNVNQTDIAGTEYHFLEDRVELDLDFDREFEGLPYRFVDFQAMDKKIDPKKLQFGSKISKESPTKQQYYTVTKVISPEILVLDSGITIRLIGVKEDLSQKSQAEKFLVDKTKGQKVFLKFDSQKYDNESNLLCYLYLKNRTFLNAHLIKQGLAQPDTLSNYKYREKFIKLNTIQ
ncbi:MAG: DNA methyltransferase [Bacteroidota bacterium]|jgi:site-specific DNA-methyltransferase (adenine-specific)|nr:DNA methyltransferase [Bacteroidota bacterium]HHU97795.1 site-specific DNA-methyltransferase [Petrimonas sp.]